MSVNLPKYAKRPLDRRGKVEATERGWELQLPNGRTELLKCCKNLKSKLKELEKQLKDGVDLQEAVELKEQGEVSDGELFKESVSQKEEQDKEPSKPAKKSTPKKKKAAKK